MTTHNFENFQNLFNSLIFENKSHTMTDVIKTMKGKLNKNFVLGIKCN